MCYLLSRYHHAHLCYWQYLYRQALLVMILHRMKCHRWHSRTCHDWHDHMSMRFLPTYLMGWKCWFGRKEWQKISNTDCFWALPHKIHDYGFIDNCLHICHMHDSVALLNLLFSMGGCMCAHSFISNTNCIHLCLHWSLGMCTCDKIVFSWNSFLLTHFEIVRMIAIILRLLWNSLIVLILFSISVISFVLILIYYFMKFCFDFGYYLKLMNFLVYHYQ